MRGCLKTFILILLCLAVLSILGSLMIPPLSWLVNMGRSAFYGNWGVGPVAAHGGSWLVLIGVVAAIVLVMRRRSDGDDRADPRFDVGLGEGKGKPERKTATGGPESNEVSELKALLDDVRRTSKRIEALETIILDRTPREKTEGGE